MKRHNEERQNKPGKISMIFLCVIASFAVLIAASIVNWVCHGYETAYVNLQKMYQENKMISCSLSSIGALNLTGFFSDESKANLNSMVKQGVSKTLMAEKRIENSSVQYFSSMLGKSSIETIKEKSSYVFKMVYQIWSVVILTLKVVVMKLMIMISSIPLFVMLGLVGVVDGLGFREIRRAELGRESSYLFHMLGKWVFKGILLLLLVWVAMPFAVNPQLILLPMSLLFAYMVSMTARRFKKYL